MTQSTRTVSPASPWARLIAFLIDLPVLVVIGWAFRASLQVAGIEYLIGWIYFAALESSPLQATPGKRLLGLKVADVGGMRPGFWKASGRYVLKLISVVSLGAGFVMMFFTERKQAFHDYATGCVVLSSRRG